MNIRSRWSPLLLLLASIVNAQVIPAHPGWVGWGARVAGTVVAHGGKYGVDAGWKTTASAYTVPVFGIGVYNGVSTTQHVFENFCWWAFDIPDTDGYPARRVVAGVTLPSTAGCDSLHIPADGEKVLFSLTRDHYKAEARTNEQHSKKLAELTVIQVFDPTAATASKDALLGTAATPSQAGTPTTYRVSLASNPTGADIDVDGQFSGSTPSSLDLSPGEHRVVVHKKGFKSWERVLQVRSGEIHISAELESESTAQP